MEDELKDYRKISNSEQTFFWKMEDNFINIVFYKNGEIFSERFEKFLFFVMQSYENWFKNCPLSPRDVCRFICLDILEKNMEN